MKQKTYFLLVLMLIFILSACATFHKNTPLSHYNKTEGYRFDNLDRGMNNTDSLFIILALSGGGTRAASLSYGVMEALREKKIMWKGQEKRLIDEIDIISSVSGGSFTAAYYGLHGDGLFDGTFEQKFLKKNIEGALLFELFFPINWYKLAGYGYSRSDLAADYYNKEIFRGATYADLIKKGTRPFVILNATDMSTGEQFPFIQDQFDLICTDLGSLHIARAVASSSAFPGLLTPLTYVNYAGKCHYQESQWVELAMGGWRISPERTNMAEIRRSYYQTPSFMRQREYVHLFDGGVSDNLGLRGIIYSLKSGDSSYSIQRFINKEIIEKFVVIIVNAATDPETKRDTRARVPGVDDVIITSATIPLGRYTFETTQRLQSVIDDYKEGVQMREDCDAIIKNLCPDKSISSEKLYSFDSYVINVAFDFIEDQKIRFDFKNLPTTFKLPEGTVDSLRKMGTELLFKDPDFIQLINELK